MAEDSGITNVAGCARAGCCVLLPLQVPTPEQRARAANVDDSFAINPEVYDTAPQAVVDDLGVLHRCLVCQAEHRTKVDVPIVWPPTVAAIQAIVDARLKS